MFQGSSSTLVSRTARAWSPSGTASSRVSSSSTTMMGHASSSGRLSAPPRLAHHNASVQVDDAGKGRSGFAWIADLCRTRPATASAPSSIKPWPSSKRQSSNSRTRAEGPKRWNRKLHSRRDAFGGRSEHELDPSEPARECAARDCLSCPSRCARRRDMDGAQRHDQPGGMHSSLVRAARFGSRSHTMNRREPARRPRMPTPTTVAS